MILLRVVRRLTMLATLLFCALGIVELNTEQPGQGPISALFGETESYPGIGSRERVREPLHIPRGMARDPMEQALIEGYGASDPDAGMILTITRIARKLSAVAGSSAVSLMQGGGGSSAHPGRKVVRVQD